MKLERSNPAANYWRWIGKAEAHRDEALAMQRSDPVYFKTRIEAARDLMRKDAIWATKFWNRCFD